MNNIGDTVVQIFAIICTGVVLCVLITQCEGPNAGRSDYIKKEEKLAIECIANGGSWVEGRSGFNCIIAGASKKPIDTQKTP